MAEYSRVHVAAYLSFCLLTIAVLVFLASTQPFVLTDILGDSTRLGDKVGSLAFADELVTIVMCPVWGALSDKIGTRPIVVVGLFIQAIALFLYTAGKSVYPELLIVRSVFAIGASAGVSMMTAILGELSSRLNHSQVPGYMATDGYQDDTSADDENSSELQREFLAVNEDAPFLNVDQTPVLARKNAKLSGVVGMASGLGAVLSVAVLLPLPTWLDKEGSKQGDGLKHAYYIVGGIAAGFAIIFLFTLHRDRTKSLRLWLTGGNLSIFDEAALDVEPSNYAVPYLKVLSLGFEARRDKRIALAYVGGFVARSATVALTLFVPLWVNVSFYSNGKCKLGSVHDPPSAVKNRCHEAYVLAAILTGIANTVALVFAPVWGVLGDYIGQHATLVLSSLFGFIGCIGLGATGSPSSPAAFVFVCFLGAGQIGAIVISMSMCTNTPTPNNGAIAGVYSLCGGIGILFITKAGGMLSDMWAGAPFIILGQFYVLLIAATVWARPELLNSLRVRRLMLR